MPTPRKRPANPPAGAVPPSEYRPTNPPPPEVRDPDERADDEQTNEAMILAWLTNLKESFDIHRDDERFSYRLGLLELLSQKETTKRQQEELFHQRLVQTNQAFQITWNPQQALRDQARDSAYTQTKGADGSTTQTGP